MKVVHILKRIETIDNDIKELRKLEKSIARDKSFTTPIYMTIEKQINIILDERNKLLGLSILNPPANMVAALEGEENEASPEPLHSIHEQQKPVKKAKPQPEKKKAAPAAAKPAAPVKKPIVIPDDDDIPMLTQDQIDAKFSSLKAEHKPEPKHEVKTDIKAIKEEKEDKEDSDSMDDTGIKLLDVALEKGTLNRKTLEKEKKVRFFRENFPAD
jgi:hypothetical protein